MDLDEQPNELSRATYVQAPTSKPIGLDLNQFAAENPVQISSGDKKDLEIINEVMENHTQLIGVVNRRMSSIKVILSFWNKGEISASINALNMMGDNSVIMDVLNHTFAENQKIDLLNYDNVI